MIKAVIVWQVYCERVKNLSVGYSSRIELDEVKAEEGVEAYRVG